MKAKACFTALCAVLLLASCGQQHQAESVVEDFMQQYVKDYGNLRITEFDDIDSTRYINDSIIGAMRKATESCAVYKPGIEYGENPDPKKKLKIVRVSYEIGGATYNDTYYLDNGMQCVVALKSNKMQ